MHSKCFHKISVMVGLFICSLMSVSSLSAQQQEFNLMGKRYRNENGKWYTFFQGRIGDEVIPQRLIVRLTDRGYMELFDFNALNIRGVSIDSDRFLNGYYILLIDNLQDPLQIATHLEQTYLFDVLEFDAYGHNAGTPNDVNFPNQWNLQPDKVNTEKAWDITTEDSQIILAILDNGTKYDHEDLAGNIWINSAEDVNGNGQPDFFPASQGGDEDGIDNDGNGYIDDIIGWNFFSNTNLPKTSSHGTGVAGIAAARTNNSIGVAGVAGGWGSQKGVSLMIVDDASSTGNQTARWRWELSMPLIMV